MTQIQQEGITFIVCCYNSEKLIVETISAINNQINNKLPFEVILVDNNCADNTVSLVKKYWKRNSADLLVVKEEKPGLSHARKKGVSKAKFKYISFIDDDNIVENNWITKVYETFESHPEVGAIGGFNEACIQGHVPFWFRKHQSCFACGPQQDETGYIKNQRNYLWGAGLSVRTDTIKSILFSDIPMYLTGRKGKLISSGDDSEICMRILLKGERLWYINNLRLKHKIQPSRLNWKYLCSLYESFGHSDVILSIYSRLINNEPNINFTNLLSNNLLWLSRIIFAHRTKIFQYQEGKDFQTSFFACMGSIKSLIGLNLSYSHICKNIQNNFNQTI